MCEHVLPPTITILSTSILAAQGTTSLLTSSAPVWILGVKYHDAPSPDTAQEDVGLKQEVMLFPEQNRVLEVCNVTVLCLTFH